MLKFQCAECQFFPSKFIRINLSLIIYGLSVSLCRLRDTKMLSAKQQLAKSSTNTNTLGSSNNCVSPPFSLSAKQRQQQQQIGNSKSTLANEIISGSTESASQSKAEERMRPTRQQQHQHQTDQKSKTTCKRETMKVKEFDEFFICFLCRGYKIEATTIKECLHSCEFLLLFLLYSTTCRINLKAGTGL